MPTLRSERLILRDWREEDLEPFARLNGDAYVMRFFPRVLTREQSDEFVMRVIEHQARHGFSLWAVEIPGVAGFAGFIGLASPTFQAHFTPCVEVGWRLNSLYWGAGYATEGGRLALAYGFRELGLSEIVSMTAAVNWPSRRVMERLRMTRDPGDDFDHPHLPRGHLLQPHVLYRLRAAAWRKHFTR